MASAIDKQQSMAPPPPGGNTAATAPIMRDDDYNPPTAFGYGVTPPPYSGDGAYQGQGYPSFPVVNQGHPIYPEDPPPYDFTEIKQEKTAPETGCSIFLRCIKKAGGVALITLAGIGGFVLTIALSPFFGMYIVGKAMSSGGCFICILDDDGAKVVGIILLAAVAIASLPVIVCSPIFAMDFAYRAGRSLYGDEFNAPGVLVWSHEFIDNLWDGCTSTTY
ncbi:hypothetical protein [Kistimonas asteriae]|uniref:hypothetical protein n=1 Tax=Kistimonas asteriae TaxID=517724 RepID=UPI001BABC907|nr:hypothetical protein [Kistimonas asteriae]